MPAAHICCLFNEPRRMRSVLNEGSQVSCCGSAGPSPLSPRKWLFFVRPGAAYILGVYFGVMFVVHSCACSSDTQSARERERERERERREKRSFSSYSSVERELLREFLALCARVGFVRQREFCSSSPSPVPILAIDLHEKSPVCVCRQKQDTGSSVTGH